MKRPEAPIERLAARAFRVPTDAPEADGTFAWQDTVFVLAEVEAGGKSGLGYSYTAPAACGIIADPLAPVVLGTDVFDIPLLSVSMFRAVRNLGRAGLCSSAISAVDVAFWDLKAKLLDLPLADLLGIERRELPIYGSGGFTSYDDARLAEQLSGWVERDGCAAVKMKIGSEPARDLDRVRVARQAAGRAELYVDANGAFTPQQALSFAQRFTEFDVSWFEEPISSDDFRALHALRDRFPSQMALAAGEYGYDPFYFRRMLEAGAVDVLQADITRCGGVTAFLKVAALADSFMTPLSAHTAPALHLHVGCAVPRFKNVEWFHDHVRIEHLFFDGAPVPKHGRITPDFSRCGLGLSFKEVDARRFSI
ncbi:enolase C-terminal domain-like protein [Dongia soli]|uniref:Enolase C-terminal domain-like protein n=1 Tax=Dongia soli TaxID=600628 RepID=A0ABU5EEB9_9PROT|nr:enolase C-terminal domain-like protein [Dongia soli]MDY0884415.1 enolase C-terminal domain-like protein [Dongia soli]